MSPRWPLPIGDGDVDDPADHVGRLGLEAEPLARVERRQLREVDAVPGLLGVDAVDVVDAHHRVELLPALAVAGLAHLADDRVATAQAVLPHHRQREVDVVGTGAGSRWSARTRSCRARRGCRLPAPGRRPRGSWCRARCDRRPRAGCGRDRGGGGCGGCRPRRPRRPGPGPGPCLVLAGPGPSAWSFWLVLLLALAALLASAGPGRPWLLLALALLLLALVLRLVLVLGLVLALRPVVGLGLVVALGLVVGLRPGPRPSAGRRAFGLVVRLGGALALRLGLGRLDGGDQVGLLHAAGAGDAHAARHRLEVGEKHGVESTAALLAAQPAGLSRVSVT